MNASDRNVIAQQLGIGCNENDTIILKDFRGYLAWTYAQKTDAEQSYTDGPLTPMTSDHGGFDLMVTLRCKRLSLLRPLTLSPGQEIALPDCKGEEVLISYTAVDHVAAIFVESFEGGVLKSAG